MIPSKNKLLLLLFATIVVFSIGCSDEKKSSEDITAAEILGNPDYQAISFGGFRTLTRDTVPTVEQLKEDMLLLAAMNIKVIRTYNTQVFGHAANVLKAIRALKNENPNFEMYVMLGAWIDCENAWNKEAVLNHDAESLDDNTAEIETAIAMANEYPDIVKVIAVGNEAMVQWAVSYYVTPRIILKWVNHLQDLKKEGKLSKDLWITSSDNYESWGGGAKNYRTKDLEELIKAVDFVSMHTYPFHDTHYNPEFWGVNDDEANLSDTEKAKKVMQRATEYAKSQYQGVADYIKSLGIEKPIHIGETGWATSTSSFYGTPGSGAADEYKEKLFYDNMRNWTNEAGMSCFYFQAINEPWKDADSPKGSENHFGLMTVDGKAKYAIWDLVDNGAFDGLSRGGNKITKTYNGDESAMLKDLLVPPLASEISGFELKTINQSRKVGEAVIEQNLVVLADNKTLNKLNNKSYPSAKLKLNSWEGSAGIQMTTDGSIKVQTGIGEWWGCAAEMKADGDGENLSNFAGGYLNFEIKGNTTSLFQVGFQTGIFADGNQTNNFVTFNKGDYVINENWKTYSIKVADLMDKANMEDVTSLIFFRGESDFDGKDVFVRNIYYSKSK